MAKAKNDQYIQGSLFEEDYLLRTLGSLVHSPEIALSELVANAWDAGATTVNITIPEERGQKLVVEDNGIGITKEDFHNRWMRLGYNRLKHQGKNVSFPPGKEGHRIAYGRNGVGRHGLLCFNDEYTVITSSSGTESTFVIKTVSESQPFVISKETFRKSDQFGTRLEVVVSENLPKPKKILEILSAKFLHDPNFVLSINKETVPLEKHSGLINQREIPVGEMLLTAYFIDSQKSSRNTLYQGIAFWQGNRLVGEPSWILGNEAVLDGRTRIAKRYTVVVKTNDLADYILEDWTGFQKSTQLNEVFQEVSKYVMEMCGVVAKENIEETKRQIRNDIAGEFAGLSPLGKYEVNEAIESIALSHPTARPEAISLAVEAIVNLEKTRSGKELLLKLGKLSEDDVEGMNSLLEKWSIRDALTVLDEIDNRLSVIEATRKLSKDKDVDELHTLHPLVTEARWLFGPEYESAEYASNSQLQTATEKVFKTKIQKNAFRNHRKRPDIVVLANATLSITGTDSFDSESQLSSISKILILELKRSGFPLGREERNQAQGYVEDFVNCGVLVGSATIDAFVIGERFSQKIQPIVVVQNDQKSDVGKIRIATFDQLVDTAEKRLFGLRKKLNSRYDDIPGMDLFRQTASQLDLDLK